MSYCETKKIICEGPEGGELNIFRDKVDYAMKKTAKITFERQKIITGILGLHSLRKKKGCRKDPAAFQIPCNWFFWSKTQ
jgi:hypothetical protein